MPGRRAGAPDLGSGRRADRRPDQARRCGLSVCQSVPGREPGGGGQSQAGRFARRIAERCCITVATGDRPRDQL